MLSTYAREIIQNIVSGVIIEKPEDTLYSTRNFICSSFETNTTIKKDFENQQRIKKEQEKLILEYVLNNANLFIPELDETAYLTKGGESRVYFNKDGKHVIKLNDAVYYSNWLDFFNSLVIHNLIFPETAYELIGFTQRHGILFAVLKQHFILSTEDVDLDEVEQLLSFNGFEKIKRNDYYNKTEGLLLEDIHDENVIKQNGSYFFIDTVFYINRLA